MVVSSRTTPCISQVTLCNAYQAIVWSLTTLWVMQVFEWDLDSVRLANTILSLIISSTIAQLELDSGVEITTQLSGTRSAIAANLASTWQGARATRFDSTRSKTTPTVFTSRVPILRWRWTISWTMVAMQDLIKALVSFTVTAGGRITGTARVHSRTLSKELSSYCYLGCSSTGAPHYSHTISLSSRRNCKGKDWTACSWLFFRVDWRPAISLHYDYSTYLFSSV